MTEKQLNMLKTLQVVINANDSVLATRLALNYLKSPSKKKESDDDEEIQLVCRTPARKNGELSNRNSPLSTRKRNGIGADSGKTREKGRTDKYANPQQLTDQDISVLLNESCTSDDNQSEEDDDEKELWTVTKKTTGEPSPGNKGTDTESNHSVPSTPKTNRSVKRTLNLDSPKSTSESNKKNTVSPIKLRRKTHGVDSIGSQSPKSGEGTRNLRERSHLKRPSWLQEEFEITPSHSFQSSPSTNRSKYNLRAPSSPSPSKSILNSPRTPSLRRQVLEARTPRSSLKRDSGLTPRRKTDDEAPATPPKSTPKRVVINSDRDSDQENDNEDSDSEEGGNDRKKTRSAAKKSSVKKRLSMTPCKAQIPSTPTSVKRVGHGFLTPVIAERGCKLFTNTPKGKMRASEAIDYTRAQLHVSTVPSSLPCREKEFKNIYNFISAKICDRAGGCMYISGVPGTGKTATVHAVVRQLQSQAIEKQLPSFDFVEVNGLRLTEPRQAYVRILQALQNEKMTAEQAHKILARKFCGRPKKSTVLLVDELDYLCNKRQDVIYNILEWSCESSSKLVVITIANTMDLPERTLKGKVTSRMGLTRLVFQPYSYQQLQEIVLNRLSGLSSFHPDAVQLVARKVAAVSGDARRALDICRRSTELLKNDDSEEVVTVSHVEKSLNQIFSGARVLAIRNCSLMWQYVLRAIRDETLRTGLEETNVKQVYNHLLDICSLEGSVVPTVGEVLSICSSLTLCGLIVAEKGRTDLNKKLSLNVSSDDIHYALS